MNVYEVIKGRKVLLFRQQSLLLELGLIAIVYYLLDWKLIISSLGMKAEKQFLKTARCSVNNAIALSQGYKF